MKYLFSFLALVAVGGAIGCGTAPTALNANSNVNANTNTAVTLEPANLAPSPIATVANSTTEENTDSHPELKGTPERGTPSSSELKKTAKPGTPPPAIPDAATIRKQMGLPPVDDPAIKGKSSPMMRSDKPSGEPMMKKGEPNQVPMMNRQKPGDVPMMKSNKPTNPPMMKSNRPGK